jgi:hypothetical protein
MVMEDKHFEALYPETTLHEEIEKLLGFVRGGNSCQLLGLPGVGRSDLLEFLAYNKQIRDKHLGDKSKYVHFVLVDFSEMRNRPLVDVVKFLFLGLADSLRAREMWEEYERVNDSFREALSFNDELVLFQELKMAIDFLALERKLTLIFLFTMFEEYIPTVDKEFFRNLRILRNRVKYRFSVIFSLTRPLESLVDPLLLSDYYEYVAGHWVYIRFYDDVSTNFLLSYLEKLTGKKLDKKVHAKILELTGGYAKITRLAIEACLAADRKETRDLEGFLLEQNSIKAALAEIWLELSPAEQSDILLNSFEDPVVDKYLEDSGLIKGKVIQIPLFATYVRTPAVLPKGKEEKIVFDENTNSIRKGEAVLSDNLTSSEFRLLRYLLQNPERVIERDEIIAIVWEGVKSTAGITDQAVDQLIFRLRRKIEEDPNSPQYLQTVKGRGFRFVA